MSKKYREKFPKAIWLAELDMFENPNQLSMAWFRRGEGPDCNNFVRMVKYIRADTVRGKPK
jgi:hypothetical protein